MKYQLITNGKNQWAVRRKFLFFWWSYRSQYISYWFSDESSIRDFCWMPKDTAEPIFQILTDETKTEEVIIIAQEG